ncbi:hypothetical protein C2E23DRAFT_9440 [Lenzites betulinus]|nr:hypothetical protein C2E23DRAFT_9440 [Lenzites betulinus]
MTPEERRANADVRSAVERFCTYDDIHCFYTIDNMRRRSGVGPIPTTCSFCSKKTGTRLTCLQCSTYGSIDFCPSPACLESSVTLTANRTHLPSHEMTAKDRLNGVLRGRPLKCVSCQENAQRPYWYCLECTIADTLICEACDSKHRAGVSVDQHAKQHTLFRCLLHPTGGGLPVEERLSSLEGQVAMFSGRFDSLDDRLSRIERLLETLVAGRGSALD